MFKAYFPMIWKNKNFTILWSNEPWIAQLFHFGLSQESLETVMIVEMAPSFQSFEDFTHGKSQKIKRVEGLQRHLCLFHIFHAVLLFFAKKNMGNIF